MIEKSSTAQKVCSFYVSNMHFATMILPFVNKQISENTNIVTFFENNYTTNIELVLSKLTIKEENKKELLEINWRNTNVVKYLNVEKVLKGSFEKNGNNLIIVNGNEDYINIVNGCIERYLQKNYKKTINSNTKIMNFFEVGSFNDNIKEILDNHQLIFNTAGEHRIEDVFEGYENKKEKFETHII